MTAQHLRQVQQQTPSPYDSPPPAEWMPLDEVAAAWASFGAHTRHPWGWLATSSAFAALAQEAAALQQVRADTLPYVPVCVNAAAGPHEALCEALDEGLACWQCVLLWLEQLARHQPAAPTSEDEGEDAPVTPAALLPLTRWHRARLCALLARLSLQGEPAAHTTPRQSEVQE